MQLFFMKSHRYFFLSTALSILMISLAGCGGTNSETPGASQDSWVGVKQLGTSQDDFGWGVAADSVGNVYVAGYTFGGLDSNTNVGSYDIFLTKYNTAGGRMWTRQLGTSLGDSATSVATDAAGNIYVAGYTDGDLVGNQNAGTPDAIIVKYDTAGNLLWTRQFGSAVADYASKITVDVFGNVYVTGWTFGNLDGHSSAGDYDIILVKFDAAGNKLWDRQFGSTASDECRGIATDASGNIYLAGSTTGSIDGAVNSGGYDVLLVKYDGDGNRLWVRQIGTPFGDSVFGVSTDVQGDLYVAGVSNGDLDDHINAGNDDLFLIKYDAAGNKLWSRLQGTGMIDGASSVVTDAAGNVYLSGYSSGNLVGNVNSGGYDTILLKYNSAGDQLWARQYGSSVDDFSHASTFSGVNKVFVTGYTLGNLGSIHAGSADIFLLQYSADGVRQ